MYVWRGSSVSIIVYVAETFPPVGGEPALFQLTVSRRSDRRILEAANHHAAPHYAAYDQVEPLQAADGAAAGEVRLAVHDTAAVELDALVEAVRAVHTGAPGGLWSDVAVLTRDNAHAEGVFDALTGAGVPVEIVGLKGLLRLPEVAEVVATLHLLHDVTHNPSMLTLLTGPRWAIGPRDLRLLSRRALEVSGRAGAGPSDLALADQLVEIADGVDPAELPALDDALADPGEAAYSAEALERFDLLAGELRYLRAHVGEPLLDLVRRIMDASGVDVELASAVSPAAAARRDNLDLFVKAVADFQAVDGDVTLSALLAYLTAEDDQGNGLDLATPSEADSVKLLTVHRAKGLEWASVFLVGVCETRFPSGRSRVLWTSSPSVLPAPLRGDAADLPQLAGHDKAALDAYRTATRSHDAEEELRLGYVAVTRPAHLLAVSSYCWGPRTTSYGPSAYQVTLRELLEQWGEQATPWRDKPAKGDPHPYADDDPSVPWPTTVRTDEARLRLDAAARVVAADPLEDDADLDMLTAARIGEWDDEIDRLLTEARRDRGDVVEVPMPSSLSATAVARLRDDADGFARDLARPMPRPPSPAARFGTRFHAWVEARFGQLALLDTDEISGRGDSDVADDAELQELVEAFEKGDFADRVPVAVEPAFALVLDGQVVRGRIDAVYREPDGSVLVVDWKTSHGQTADPLQLAIYRLAWAELHDLPLAQVRAGFYYVRSGELVEPDGLPERDGLEQLFRS
jgi:DNA helicase-2/ATP-dependent DNA helicase PcrA